MKTKTNPKPIVLITGVTGALARQVVERLRADYTIIGVYFRAGDLVDESITTYRVDMTKRGFEDIFRTHKICRVIHMGRINVHEATMKNRYNSNVLGTQKLLDLSVKYGVEHITVLSTFFVYGANPYNPALLDEATPLKAAGLTSELIDSVELENLANIYMWKHPELHITILRPCNIIGPQVRNSMSRLLSDKLAPCLLGFSPIMQFMHLSDMAEAIVLANAQTNPGIYNVAPDDYVAFQDALEHAGCRKLALPSLPPTLPTLLSRVLRKKSFPPYLIEFMKYPVVLDGSKFANTFGFAPKIGLKAMFDYYRDQKR